MARKVVLYTRVSTDDQKENGFSLQDQEARLRRHCQRKGFEVVAHYQDDHSAKNFKRPEFSRFLQDMKEKVIRPDLFLCVRMDRFSRNLEESLQMLARFKDLGLEFQTLENNYDLSQPENLIPYVLNMVLPQVDNERRGLNTKRGMRQARREGRWVGAPPRGYSFQRINNRSVIVPN
jgi:site-specific DNA recombinase